MYLLPHINHVCYTDATAIYFLFLTYHTITCFHSTTAIVVDYPQWDKYTLKTRSFLGYECQALVSFTLKFQHLPNYSHQNGSHNTELNRKAGHEKVYTLTTLFNTILIILQVICFTFIHTHVDTHVYVRKLTKILLTLKSSCPVISLNL